MLDQALATHLLEAERLLQETTLDTIDHPLWNKNQLALYLERIDAACRFNVNAVEYTYGRLDQVNINKADIDQLTSLVGSDTGSPAFSSIYNIPNKNEIREIYPGFITSYISLLQQALVKFGAGAIGKKELKKVCFYNDFVKTNGMRNIASGSGVFLSGALNIKHYKELLNIPNINPTLVTRRYITSTLLPEMITLPDTVKSLKKMFGQYRTAMYNLKAQADDVLQRIVTIEDNGKRAEVCKFFVIGMHTATELILLISYIMQRACKNIVELIKVNNIIASDYEAFMNKENPSLPVPVTEDTIMGNDYTPNESWFKMLNNDTTDINRITENIIEYYRNYRIFIRAEQSFLSDKDETRMLIDPYRGPKEASYVTYDPAILNTSKIFDEIRISLEEFSQNMTNPLTFAGSIIDQSAVSNDLSKDYREELNALRSTDIYKSTNTAYTQTAIFMIFKEILFFEDSLKHTMLSAQQVFRQLEAIHERLVENYNNEFENQTTRDGLLTFIINFMENYKLFCGELYDSYCTRLAKLNALLDDYHVDANTNVAYYSMEESFTDNATKVEEDYTYYYETTSMLREFDFLVEAGIRVEAARERALGRIFAEADEAQPENKPQDTTPENKPQDSTPENKPTDNNNNNNTDAPNKKNSVGNTAEEQKTDENKTDGNNTDANKDDENTNEEKEKEKEESLWKRLKTLMSDFVKKITGKFKEKVTSGTAEFEQISDPDFFDEYLQNGAWNSRTLNISVEGYTGPYAGGTAAGQPFKTIESDKNSFITKLGNSNLSEYLAAGTDEEIARKLTHCLPGTMKFEFKEAGKANDRVYIQEVITSAFKNYYNQGNLGEAGKSIKINRGNKGGKVKFIIDEVYEFRKKCADGSIMNTCTVTERDCENLLALLDNHFKNLQGNGGKTELAKIRSDNKRDGRTISQNIAAFGSIINMIHLAFDKVVDTRKANYSALLMDLKAKYDEAEAKKKKKAEADAAKENKNNEETSSQETNNNENKDNQETSNN